MPEPFQLEQDPVQGQTLVGPETPPPAAPVPPPPAFVFGPTPGPQELGINPMLAPTAPSVPMPAVPTPVSQDPKQQLLSRLLLGFMLGAGPNSGFAQGAGRGLHDSQAAMDAERIRQFRLEEEQALRQQAEQDKQQAMLAAQQKATAQEAQQRYQMYQTAVKTLQTRALSGAIPNKAQYDQEVNDLSTQLQRAGYSGRLSDPNILRQAATYVAPSVEGKAATIVQAFLKNPANQTVITEHPEQLAKVVVPFDRDGDGTPEMVPLLQLAQIGKIPFSVDSSGHLFAYPKGTSQENKANADGIFEDLIKKAKAEGKDTTDPSLRMALREQAIKAVPDAKADPEMKNLARQTAELNLSIKQQQVAQQPTVSDAQDAAKLVLGKQLSPSQAVSTYGGFGQSGQAFKRLMMREIVKQDPKFNFEEAEATYQLSKGSGFQNTVRYMTSVQESMPRLIQNAQALANGNIRGLNALVNSGRSQVNNVDLKRFQTDRLLVADELAKILQGGGTGSGTSDAKLQQAGSILRDSDSPANIVAALQEANSLIGFRKAALTRGTYMESQTTTPTPSGGPADLVYDPASRTFTKPRGR